MWLSARACTVLIMANTPRESNYQRRAISMIEDAGGWVVPTTRLAPVKKGIPDLFGTLRGYALCPEMKGPSTPHQKLQFEQRERLRRAGAITFVARGEEGLDQLARVIEIINAWHSYPDEMYKRIIALELQP